LGKGGSFSFSYVLFILCVFACAFLLLVCAFVHVHVYIYIYLFIFMELYFISFHFISFRFVSFEQCVIYFYRVLDFIYHPSASLLPYCSSLYFASRNSVSRSINNLIYDIAFSTSLDLPTHIIFSVILSLLGIYTSTL